MFRSIIGKRLARHYLDTASKLKGSLAVPGHGENPGAVSTGGPGGLGWPGRPRDMPRGGMTGIAGPPEDIMVWAGVEGIHPPVKERFPMVARPPFKIL